MGKFKSTAEKAFEEKLQDLLEPAVRRIHPATEEVAEEGEEVTVSEGVTLTVSTPLDLTETAKVFFQYGTYLELVGGDAPAEAPVVVTATTRGGR